MNLPANATYVTLHYYWWKNPPEWHAFISIVDEHRQRMRAFTAKHEDYEMALADVTAQAWLYKFPETPVPEKLELNLELDL